MTVPALQDGRAMRKEGGARAAEGPRGTELSSTWKGWMSYKKKHASPTADLSRSERSGLTVMGKSLPGTCTTGARLK